MNATSDSENTVGLRTDGIIWVERTGQLTEHSLRVTCGQAREFAAQLRMQGRPVLILNHAHDTFVSERILAHLKHLDFDKIAVYSASKRLNNLRDLMMRANGYELKIVSFHSKEEALAWLCADGKS